MLCYTSPKELLACKHSLVFCCLLCTSHHVKCHFTSSHVFILDCHEILGNKSFFASRSCSVQFEMLWVLHGRLSRVVPSCAGYHWWLQAVICLLKYNLIKSRPRPLDVAEMHVWNFSWMNSEFHWPSVYRFACHWLSWSSFSAVEYVVLSWWFKQNWLCFGGCLGFTDSVGIFSPSPDQPAEFIHWAMCSPLKTKYEISSTAYGQSCRETFLWLEYEWWSGP